MNAPVKTRERIIQASLELFNSQGERSVTTNHIAAHLGISPGNLYYHFRNKQMIIGEIFSAYEQRVALLLRLPEGQALNVEDKAQYLEALLAAMWDYRFLHRDLEHLLERDGQLAASYRGFAQRSLEQAKAIYQGFVSAEILLMNPQQIEALVLNSWIVLTSWVRFLATVQHEPGALSPELMRRGIYQILMLESGYLSAQAAEPVQQLLDRLHVPLELVLS